LIQLNQLLNATQSNFTGAEHVSARLARGSCSTKRELGVEAVTYWSQGPVRALALKE